MSQPLDSYGHRCWNAEPTDPLTRQAAREDMEERALQSRGVATALNAHNRRHAGELSVQLRKRNTSTAVPGCVSERRERPRSVGAPGLPRRDLQSQFQGPQRPIHGEARLAAAAWHMNRRCISSFIPPHRVRLSKRATEHGKEEPRKYKRVPKREYALCIVRCALQISYSAYRLDILASRGGKRAQKTSNTECQPEPTREPSRTTRRLSSAPCPLQSWINIDERTVKVCLRAASYSPSPSDSIQANEHLHPTSPS